MIPSTRPRRALLILILLTAACDNELQTCNTDEDCFKGELCSADNKCRKRVDPAEMGAPDLPDAPDSGPDQALADMSAPDADMSEPDQDTPDPCAGIACSMHGTCTSVAGVTSCACEMGYVPRSLSCADANQIVLASGYGHTCAIKQGALSCWGDNTKGQLGFIRASGAVPKVVALFNQEADALAAGNNHTCAIKQGALSCWGDNTKGQLGIGTNESQLGPAAALEMTESTTAVAAGARHTCAIKSGALYCWGDDDEGQLGLDRAQGIPMGPNQLTPQPLPSLATDVTAVAAGGGHTCAIKSGALYCWGDNSGGQAGQDKGDAIIPSPAQINGLNEVSAVATGNAHTCALAQGRLYCWGDNSHSQLGAGSAEAATHLPLTPTGMEAGVVAVAAGGFHTCALKGAAVYCWGANDFKQVANNTTGTHTTPVAASVSLPAGVRVITLTTGYYHTCVGLSDLTAQCWGDGSRGQLGAGLNTLP